MSKYDEYNPRPPLQATARCYVCGGRNTIMSSYVGPYDSTGLPTKVETETRYVCSTHHKVAPVPGRWLEITGDCEDRRCGPDHCEYPACKGGAQ